MDGGSNEEGCGSKGVVAGQQQGDGGNEPKLNFNLLQNESSEKIINLCFKQ